MPLLVDNDAAHILTDGDFNCSLGFRFFNYFIDVANCHGYSASCGLRDDVPYCCDHPAV